MTLSALSSRTVARRRVHRDVVTRVAPPLVLGVVLIALWQWASDGPLPSTLPSPAALLDYLSSAVLTSTFWSAVGSTMTSWAFGFVISVAIGLVLGLMAGLSRVADDLLAPIVEFFRPIPSIVYLPLVVLVAGTGTTSVVVLVAGGAIWPVLLQAAAGVRDTDPVLRDMGRAYGLTRWQRIRHCVIPSAAPFAATGLRISATISLVIVITTELLATGRGMGGVIASSYQSGSYQILFGMSLAAAVIGMLLDQLLGQGERRLLHWHPAHREKGRR